MIELALISFGNYAPANMAMACSFLEYFQFLSGCEPLSRGADLIGFALLAKRTDTANQECW